MVMFIVHELESVQSDQLGFPPSFKQMYSQILI